jgi:hypothetical protein
VGELAVGVDGLPPGVSAAPVAVPEKGGEVKLKLEAAADAAASSGSISVWIAPQGSPEGSRALCQFELKGAFADAGDLLINQTELGWLTVLEKKP